MGRWRRRIGRWRRLRGDVGGVAVDEEVEPPTATNRPRGAMDQRGERNTWRPRVSRSTSRRTGEARDDARIGQWRLSADGIRFQRKRHDAAKTEGDCLVASWHWR